jgi:hypothetical protein
MSEHRHPRFSVEVTRAIADFLDFVEDRRTAEEVAASLALLLRTEPPVRVDIPQLVAVVKEWAGERAAATGGTEGEFMLAAARHIIDAYRAKVLTHFEPKAFYRPFTVKLLAECRDEDRAFLRDGLRQPSEKAAKPEPVQVEQRASPAPPVAIIGVPASEFHAPEPTQADHPYASIHDAVPAASPGVLPLTREKNLNDLVEGLIHSPPASDADFEVVINQIRAIALDDRGAPPESLIVRLAEIAVDVFNKGHVARAAQLFAISTESISRLTLTQWREFEIRRAVKSTQLDVRRFMDCINNEERHAEVAPIVRFFADLDARRLLGQLENERGGPKSQVLVNILTVHGYDALPIIVEKLASPDIGSCNAEFQSSLIRLLTRIGLPPGSDERYVAGLIGPHLCSVHMQVRRDAATAFGSVAARDVVPYALKALELSSYTSSIPNEELLAHLGRVLRLLVRSRNEAAILAVAEYATGARDGGFRLGRQLRDAAVKALAARSQPLPRRAVLVLLNNLKELTGKKFLRVTGSLSLGGDSQAAAGLVALLRDSAEPEVREALELPAVRKLLAQAELLHNE